MCICYRQEESYTSSKGNIDPDDPLFLRPSFIDDLKSVLVIDEENEALFQQKTRNFFICTFLMCAAIVAISVFVAAFVADNIQSKFHTAVQQVTTMLATSENVLFTGHNHLLTTGTDDRSLTGTRAIMKVSGHQYQWLAGGYDLEIRLLGVASMVVTRWIVAFLRSKFIYSDIHN